MHPLVIQPPSPEQFVPVLVAVGIALVFFVLGRGLGARKYAKLVRELEQSRSRNSSLERGDACPRPVPSDPSDIVFELVDIVIEEEIEPCDSASATSRFSRAS